MAERSLGQFLNEAQEYLDSGDINKSLQTANEAQDIANIQENHGANARALNIISLCYFELNNKTQSLDKAKGAMNAAKKVNHQKQIAYAHFTLAKAYFLNKKINNAEVMLHEGLLLTKNNNYGDIEAKIKQFLFEIESISSEEKVNVIEDDQAKSEIEKTAENEQEQALPENTPSKSTKPEQSVSVEFPLQSSEQENDAATDIVGGSSNSILNIPQVFNHDSIAKDDLGLGYEDYSNAFSNFISSDKNIDQLVIGLHGEWGRGKSTLMDSIKKKLDQNGFITVSLNAWKYKEEVNIWGAFFHNLIAQVFQKLNWKKKFSYRLQLYRHKWILFSLYLFFTFSISYTLYTEFLTENKIPIIINYFILVAISIFGAFKVANGVLSKFGMSATELFRSLGDKDRLGVIGTMDENFNSFYHSYSKIKTDRKPIIIFVDDLDRCPPHRIVSVVNAINTLTINKGFIFFIGYDKDFVAAAIRSEYKDIIENFSDELGKFNFGYNFLDKIIQVPFKIPKGSRDSIIKYAESILKTSDADQNVEEKKTTNGIENGENENGTDAEKDVDVSDSIKLDDNVEIEKGEKPTEENLNDITLEIIRVGVNKFDLNNPRSIKKFGNVFKLLVYIAYESGLLRNNQITPNQIGYYLIFNMFHPRELSYISDSLFSISDFVTLKPDSKANVDVAIFHNIKSIIGFQFNHFSADLELTKFTVIRNLVGRSFTF